MLRQSYLKPLSTPLKNNSPKKTTPRRPERSLQWQGLGNWVRLQASRKMQFVQTKSSRKSASAGEAKARRSTSLGKWLDRIELEGAREMAHVGEEASFHHKSIG